jgi:hypothetical protein
MKDMNKLLIHYLKINERIVCYKEKREHILTNSSIAKKIKIIKMLPHSNGENNLLCAAANTKVHQM